MVSGEEFPLNPVKLSFLSQLNSLLIRSRGDMPGQRQKDDGNCGNVERAYYIYNKKKKNNTNTNANNNYHNVNNNNYYYYYNVNNNNYYYVNNNY